MHRVRRDVSVLAFESNFDHDEVMNMLQVITDSVLGMLWMAVSNDQVSCSTNTNFVGNVWRQNELTLVPSDIDLWIISKR